MPPDWLLLGYFLIEQGNFISETGWEIMLAWYATQVQYRQFKPLYEQREDLQVAKDQAQQQVKNANVEIRKLETELAKLL